MQDLPALFGVWYGALVARTTAAGAPLANGLRAWTLKPPSTFSILPDEVNKSAAPLLPMTISFAAIFSSSVPGLPFIQP